MDKIGFKTSSKEDAYEGKTFEDYDHTIKLFGVPIFRSTKKHIVDTSSKGKPQQQ
mgnify:FL=1|tara:strand:- start:1153 stop:1317 length:165 start_codon:yes stop_codon:yes gene_type:complete